VEAAFEFPLLAGAFAGFKERGARSGRLPAADFVVAAGGDRKGEFIGSSPDACPGKKDVCDAGADHLLEFDVGEAVGLNGAHVFAGHIGARDAFVVGGERNRDTEFAIEGQGMIFAGDAENGVIASEIDFNHDVFVGHFVEQPVRVIFPHDVDTVTDTLRAGLFNGKADVTTEAFVGNQR